MTKKSKNVESENLDEIESVEKADNEEKLCDKAADEKDLNEELAKKEEELLKLKDQYQRTLAEYDNFKKRTVKEKESIYIDSVGDTVAALLPVLDNLMRAVDSFEDKESEYFKGVEMILKQTDEIFKNLGVSEIKSVGEVFDPNIHYAVMHADDENVPDNTVVEEFQKGYKYKDKVIRYAMVKVAN